MPRSFDEYATETGLRRQGRVADFFDAHPDLLEQVKAAREFPQAPWSEIVAWLQDDYGFTRTGRALSDYMRAHVG